MPLSSVPDASAVVDDDGAEIHTLANGMTVRVRPIRASDADALRRAFEGLSPTSRFRRFFGSLDRLDDATVRYLTEVDGVDHVAIVAGTDSPDLKSETGLGVARFIRLRDDAEVAEAAVVVVDDYQGLGIGTLLSSALARAAREHGVKRFRAEVLASNEPVRQLLRDVNATVVRTDGPSIVFEIPTSAPAPEHAAADGFQGMIRRLLRESAAQVSGFFRSLASTGNTGTDAVNERR